ncbi:uncharacterized protein DNG_03397 [Cephalotrichum gorgonifer]|uniref:Uncharacterized protein n=1 Tax=Cephalotrichum gorgonifer TaxID=2041049 RepID=A0AAE8MU69_9PEZI|nr:uncharacterized protein DNG_03397 [Cephalotrichum gorgonifer]
MFLWCFTDVETRASATGADSEPSAET